MKKTVNCVTCGAEFESYNPNPKFCKRECKAISQRHDIDDNNVIILYLSGMTQTEVAEELGTTRKVIENSMIRTNTKRRIAAKRDQWGNKNTCGKVIMLVIRACIKDYIESMEKRVNAKCVELLIKQSHMIMRI